jgi:hypothetical protein
MTKRTIISLLIFSCVTVSFILLGCYIPFCELSFGKDPRAWFPIVNTHFNSYHMWRIDHVAGVFSEALSTWSAHTFIPLSLAILCFGTYRIVRALSWSYSIPPLTNWIISIGATLVVLAITGPDAVTLSALAWLPLLSVSVTVLMTISRAGLALGAAPLWLLALFVSIETSIAANQLAPLAAMAACLVGFTILPADDIKPLPRHELYSILVLVCGPALYASFSAPPAPFPDYPYLAHVVPDDGLAGVIRPLLGLDYPLQLVDRGAVQRLYAGPSIVLTILATCCFFIARRGDPGGAGTLLLGACGLGAIACLDTVLPERFAVIAPLMSASRLLPWGTSLSLTPWALGLGAWLLCIGSSTYLRSSARLFVAWTIALSSCAITQPAWWSPQLSKMTISRLLEDESLRKVALSPSLAVMRAFELSTPGFFANPEEFKLLARAEMQTINRSAATMETSPVGNGRTLDRVADGSPHTRWTSNRNQQIGDELLTLRFSRPTPIRGIELDPGEYAADFPRGLTIRGGPCREEETRLLAYFPSWQGALSFTAEGFPYFSGQDDVRVLFAKEELVECLFARQTSTAPFAWSVAEARLITH